MFNDSCRNFSGRRDLDVASLEDDLAVEVGPREAATSVQSPGSDTQIKKRYTEFVTWSLPFILMAVV